MKVETYGLKVEDAGQHPIYKVHTHDDKMSLKASTEKKCFPPRLNFHRLR